MPIIPKPPVTHKAKAKALRARDGDLPPERPIMDDDKTTLVDPLAKALGKEKPEWLEKALETMPGEEWLSKPEGRSAAGRPTKYTPDMGEKIFAAMQEGASLHEAAMIIGVNYDTLNEWRKEDGDHYKGKEFSEAVNAGIRAAEAWWNAAGRKGMFMGKEFNATVYGFTMKNRFGWKDRHDVTSNDKSIQVNFLPSDADV